MIGARRCLAEVGAGTIDQAIMAVSPFRVTRDRLLGLSRQVLIVDEAHAYDAYKKDELRQLFDLPRPALATAPLCFRQR